MLHKLYLWTMSLAAHRRASTALGAISFVESSFFPIPADVLFVPMCLAKPERTWHYALIASVTSVLGGIFGWAIGHYAFDLIAKPMLISIGKMDSFTALQSGAGDTAILIMLVTSGLAHVPPMKVVTILAGALSFNPVLFILSAIVARGGRFYGLGWLLHRYGPQMVHFIERRMALVAGGIVALAAVAWVLLKGH